ncbi:mycothione reductase [Microbacteriaceae bacterium VKM Ac-2854]|nr:mycothione reductase [Microbacteriaceae bacterium VKM Ac-2854]
MEPDSTETVPRRHDLIVIGAGSGNSVIGPEFADLDVGLIDAGEWFGGTCLNAGCIPTKMFVHVADVVTEVREGGRIGVESGIDSPDWATVRDRVFAKTDKISNAGFRYRDVKSPNVTVYRESFGFASIGEVHVLESASGVRIAAPRVVIASGSRPRPLLAAYAPDPAIHDSDSIMRIEQRPERLLILGGGSIAAEFAHIFAGFGTAITIAARADRMLTSLDEDIARRFTAIAQEKFDVRLGVEAESIERDGAVLRVTLSDESVVEVDAVLVALGRTPNTDTIAAGWVGLDLHPDGRLAVDEFQRVLAHGVSVPGLWGLGDVSSAHELKHTANHEARIVAHNLAHPDDLEANTLWPVPAAVFAHPQIAHFGLTEAQARAEGLDVVAVTQEFRTTAFGWALEDTTSVCTLVVDRDGGLLGAHILGPEASILIQPLVQAASFGQSIHGLARGQYWPHPAASEVVENALLKAEDALKENNA